MSEDYIRGGRQLKALFFFVEALWLFLIGRDTRNLWEEEKQWLVYSGWDFMRDRLRCMRRELEIFFGVARYYKIVFHPDFWESLRKANMREIEIEELKLRYES